MRYEARITAYDMLDSICVAVVLYDTDPEPGVDPALELQTASIVRGTGESDPREWLRDALITALETL